MPGQLEIGDEDQIREARKVERQHIIEERLRQRAERDRQVKERTWQGVCPVCFMEPGEPCITVNGKRALRHRSRPF